MVTLQEYLNQHYPNKEIEKIEIVEKDLVGELDLSGYSNLRVLYLYGNKLITTNFLKTIPNLEKLESLLIYDNNIQPTDINIFSRFVNLRELKIGTSGGRIGDGKKRNYFYGSLKAYQNLTKLNQICIEATDVNEGLEYLPSSLANPTLRFKHKVFGGGQELSSRYHNFECSSHDLDVGCKYIQDALKKFDYDLEAWQLAHPAEMFRARPELFAMEDSKEKWLNALNSKIEKTQEKLKEVKNDPNKIKKIKRLNTKLGELNVIKQLLEERTVFEDSLEVGVRWYEKFKEGKSTQTEPAKTQDQETQTEEWLEYQMPGSWPSKK